LRFFKIDPVFSLALITLGGIVLETHTQSSQRPRYRNDIYTIPL
jgi:hypothetical protein